MSHEEIYLDICRNVRGVCTFVIHCKYVCVGGEMVDCGESDKMIKISGKIDKSDTFNRFNEILLPAESV